MNLLTVLLVILQLSYLVQCQLLPNSIRQLQNLLENPAERVKDTKDFEDEYDFIIIGGGSGGSVMANRLSEIANWKVLLLEAGVDETFLSDVPLLAALSQIGNLNWGYKTQKMDGACLGLEGGVCNQPRGKVLGGSSTINFMIYQRGHPKDFDDWSKAGNPTWNYSEVLPYFMKSEDNQMDSELIDPNYHNKNGYLTVSGVPHDKRLVNCFLKAGRELGYPNNDYNTKQVIGFAPAQTNLRFGRRCSAAKAFLRPVRNRNNLKVALEARVTKIVLDKNQARGVEFYKGGKKRAVRATKEVILSAGAINSPHLLMLAGIGPKEDLEKLGIPVAKNLQVGFNMQDHMSFPGLAFRVNDTVSIVERRLQFNPRAMFDYLALGRGPFTVPGGAMGLAFHKTKYAENQVDGRPDMELVMGGGAISGDFSGTLRNLLGITDKFYRSLYKDMLDQDAFSIVPVLLVSRSKGRVRLKSRNPFHWPIIEPNYFDDVRDLYALRDGVKMIPGGFYAEPLFPYETHVKPLFRPHSFLLGI